MRRLLTFCLCLFYLSSPGHAQDRQGNDRPSDWIVTHFYKSGIWESICDERIEDGDLRQRCYIRNVDVFSPRPQFAAQFMFLTPENSGTRIEFGMEAGTLFDPNGFRIEDMGGIRWKSQRPGCLTGLTCVFTGDDAQVLTETMLAGGFFLFTFIDRHGRPTELEWPLKGFDDAFEDFQNVAAVRGLL